MSEQDATTGLSAAGPPVAWVPRAPAPSRPEQDEFLFELREAFGAMRRHPLAIACAAALCLAAALAAIVVRPPDYVSSAQVLLDPRGLKVTENELVPTPSSSDVNDAIIDTQVRLLTSDGVLGRVVETLRLGDDPDFSAGAGLLGRLKAALLGEPPAARGDPNAVATARLGQRTTVLRGGKSFVVTVSVRTRSPEGAARIAAEIVTVFLSDLEARRRAMIAQARSGMASTLTGQRERLSAAEDAVERYKRSIGIVDQDGRVLNTARMSELNSQLLAAKSSTRALAARLEQLEALQRSAGAGDLGSDVVESPLLTQLKTSRAEVVRQQENLKATLGARHPQVLEIEAQVRSLNRAIAGEIGRLFAAARNDYRTALAREQALAAEVGRMETDTGKTNLALVALRQLEREALAQRSVYEKFLERERELREQEGVGGTNASVVAGAKPSLDPVGVKPGLLLAAATAFGLLLGAGGVVASERLSGRVRSAGRLTARTGLEVVATLPVSRSREHNAGEIASLLARGRSSATSRALYGVTDGLEAIASQAPLSLLVVSGAEEPARAIVSSNLALAETARGRRTLLVDAGTDRLGWLAPGPGLAGSVVSCSVEGFPPFSAVVAPGELPPRRRPEGHARPAEEFDRVLIDVGGGGDELGLRRLADEATAILVVVESGVSTYAGIANLQASLAKNGGKVLGALFVVPGRDEAVPTPTRIVARAPSARGTALTPLRAGYAAA